jgi:hypothetical protein
LIPLVATRTTTSLFLCLSVLGCGSRTSLDALGSGSGVGDGGAPSGSTTSSTSTGSGASEDPCHQPMGRAVISTLPPGPFADSPDYADVGSAQVYGERLYLANFWSVYTTPTCGGDVALLFANPDGELNPNSPGTVYGAIGAMAVNELGVYWWASFGADGNNPHLWHTTPSGASTTEVPTTFAYPAMVAGPGGVWLVDPAVRRIAPDDTIEYFGSAAPLDFVSLPAFDGSKVYFSGAVQDPFGPLFSIPLGGGDLGISAQQPWISQIASDGETLYGLRPGDPSALVQIAKDGTQTVLAEGQPHDADELHLVGSKLIFRACEAIWAVDRASGAVTLALGEPDCYPLDPDDDPIHERTPKTSVLATDAHAFYTFDGNQIVRVRLE